MAWFKRRNKGIQTPTQEKKDIPKDYGISHLLEKLLIPMNFKRILCKP